MKMFEEIKDFRKEYVYEQYTRIVEDFKEYDKITKTKMLEAIYKVYEDSYNIIDICTTRELKFLKMILDYMVNHHDDSSKQMLFSNKYNWERNILRDKFLLYRSFDDDISIPEEIVDKVKEALKNVKWADQKKTDDINEFLVSYCKMQGSTLLPTVCQIGSVVTGVKEELLWQHMINNKLFNYYVFIRLQNIEGIKEPMPVAIFNDFFDIADDLDEQRKKQGLAGNINIDSKKFKTMFYNDFDIYNPKIKKFLKELRDLPFYWPSVIKPIRDYAMLNLERDSLKELIKSVPALNNIDLTKFFKTLDDAMNEMPSGALNGCTPNEAKQIKVRELKNRMNKEERYVEQKNACLSKKDVDLFYKIYFALLEFTNEKYKINPHLKLYKQKAINPAEMEDVINKYWENKESITTEFCLANPYKFNKEELSLTSEFKKGIRRMFIICRYEEEYTALLTEEKVYMIKGLNVNIDEIIPYDELPYTVTTSLIPFKGNLVYDSLFFGTDIKLGGGFEEMIDKEYEQTMKYYHL